jgi:hypothetical protein
MYNYFSFLSMTHLDNIQVINIPDCFVPRNDGEGGRNDGQHANVIARQLVGEAIQCFLFFFSDCITSFAVMKNDNLQYTHDLIFDHFFNKYPQACHK